MKTHKYTWRFQHRELLGDTLGNANVDISHGEVFGVIIGTNTVKNNVRMGHQLLDGAQVPGVKLHKVDHTQITRHLQKTLLQIVSKWYHHIGSVSGQLGRHVTAQKTRSTKNSCGISGSQ